MFLFYIDFMHNTKKHSVHNFNINHPIWCFWPGGEVIFHISLWTCHLHGDPVIMAPSCSSAGTGSWFLWSLNVVVFKKKMEVWKIWDRDQFSQKPKTWEPNLRWNGFIKAKNGSLLVVQSWYVPQKDLQLHLQRNGLLQSTVNVQWLNTNPFKLF